MILTYGKTLQLAAVRRKAVKTNNSCFPARASHLHIETRPFKHASSHDPPPPCGGMPSVSHHRNIQTAPRTHESTIHTQGHKKYALHNPICLRHRHIVPHRALHLMILNDVARLEHPRAELRHASPHHGQARTRAATSKWVHRVNIHPAVDSSVDFLNASTYYRMTLCIRGQDTSFFCLQNQPPPPAITHTRPASAR